jgi:peptidyl-prolyl cis-trans isomerase SurA
MALAGLLTLVFSSCQSGPKTGPDTAAIVNQTEIKNAEVEKVYQNRLKQGGQTPSPEEASTLRLNILSQMINDEMLMQRAAVDKLVANDDEVNVKFTEFKKDYTEEKFQQFLKDQGVIAEDIKNIQKKVDDAKGSLADAQEEEGQGEDCAGGRRWCGHQRRAWHLP